MKRIQLGFFWYLNHAMWSHGSRWARYVCAGKERRDERSWGEERRGEERSGEERSGEERRGEERMRGSPCGKEEQEVLALSFISSCLGLPSEVRNPLRACQPYNADLSAHTGSQHAATTKQQKAQRISVFILLMTSCVHCNVHIQNWGCRMNVNLVNHASPCVEHSSPVLTVQMKDFSQGRSYDWSCVLKSSIAQNHHCDLTGHEWHFSGHHTCGTLEIVPSQQSQGRGAPSASPSPSIPLEPKALLGIPHTIFKQSLALRSQHSLSLYLYSEALAKPSQCCFNSCYCCFSIDRALCFLKADMLCPLYGTQHPSMGSRGLFYLCWPGRWRLIEQLPRPNEATAS